MTTIGNSLSVVTLSASAPNVTVTGTINAYGTIGAYTIGGSLTVPDAALFGPAGSHFTVTNVGLIESHGASSTNKNDAGIFLASLGTVINKGKILGAEGIQMLGTSGVGFLENTGFIEGSIGSGVVFSDVATLINSGTILSEGNNGAYLRGGRVVNSGEIIGYKHGISTTLAPVTVVNSGEIIATGTSFENDGTMDFSHGIVLQDGGRVTNTSKGTIIGEQGIVIDTIAGGYVYNAGQVTGVSHSAIYLEESGMVVNAKGGTVSGRTGIDLDDGGTVRNAGIVLAVRSAVYLKDGGEVVNTGQVSAGGSGVYDLGGPGAAKIENEKRATIYGSIAGVDLIGPGSVYNAGTIGGTNGVNFMVAGSLDNVGEIDGVDIGVFAQAGLTGGNSGVIRATGDLFVSAGETFIASGLDLRGGGSFENKGTITAAVGVNLQGTATLDNTGRVLGVDVGVDSAGDGLIANSGVISESGETFVVGAATLDSAGVFLNGGVLDNSGVVEGAVGVAVESGGTVIDSGTIIGRDFDAVYFASGFNNLLVLSPTAKIEGGVFGGGGTLELEADGKTVGTAAPAQYVGFDDVTIESKAIWDMAGTFVTSLGLNLVNDGTIKESAHDLITISGALDGTGLVDLSKQVFTVNGAVGAGEKIAFTGTGETLAIGDARGFEGVVETFKAGDTIELSGVAFGGITGSHFAGGVLTIDESGGSVALTFASPDSFGKDVFLLSADGAGTAITLVKPKLAILAPALSVGSATVLPELGGDFGKAAAGKAHDLTGLTMFAPGWVPAAVGRVDLGLAVVTLHG